MHGARGHRTRMGSDRAASMTAFVLAMATLYAVASTSTPLRSTEVHAAEALEVTIDRQISVALPTPPDASAPAFPTDPAATDGPGPGAPGWCGRRPLRAGVGGRSSLRR
jgi:hypothetical protein